MRASRSVLSTRYRGRGTGHTMMGNAFSLHLAAARDRPAPINRINPPRKWLRRHFCETWEPGSGMISEGAKILGSSSCAKGGTAGPQRPPEMELVVSFRSQRGGPSGAWQTLRPCVPPPCRLSPYDAEAPDEPGGCRSRSRFRRPSYSATPDRPRRFRTDAQPAKEPDRRPPVRACRVGRTGPGRSPGPFRTVGAGGRGFRGCGNVCGVVGRQRQAISDGPAAGGGGNDRAWCRSKGDDPVCSGDFRARAQRGESGRGRARGPG